MFALNEAQFDNRLAGLKMSALCVCFASVREHG